MVKRKIKSMDLEDIPSLLQKIVSVMDREVDLLTQKDALTSEDVRNLVAYTGTLSDIYKNYRQEVLAIEKDLKSRSKEEILQLVKAEK